MEDQSHTVLLVDDDRINRLLLSVRLQAGGLQVIEACDGTEALRFLGREPVDIVLLDVMMPGLSGIEVLRAIRRRYKPEQMPVIMATAQDRSQDMVQAFDLGANDYVTKPFDFPVVLARVRAQLRKRTPAEEAPTEENTLEKPVGPGLVLEQKYRLEEKLGRGQYGTVYRATHLLLDREVAVKVLDTAVTGHEERIARFQREGISACRIQHPNAVSVLDFGVSERRVPFLVMELLQGWSLAAELLRDSPLSVQRTVQILLPICDVLASAHASGVIHRDIKPQNIFLHQTRDRNEVVKVVDFGIAKLVDEAATVERLTLDRVLGTPAYMAPERFTREPYDGRADVYSLGVMLYEALSGDHPFGPLTGDAVKMMLRQVQLTPPSLCEVNPSIPLALSKLVDRALDKDFHGRPSAKELGQEAAACAAPPDSGPGPDHDSSEDLARAES